MKPDSYGEFGDMYKLWLVLLNVFIVSYGIANRIRETAGNKGDVP